MTQTITPLRQRMLDDMKLRNMADGTRRSYVRSVADSGTSRRAVEPGSVVPEAHGAVTPTGKQHSTRPCV
jgi:hypothetical protein